MIQAQAPSRSGVIDITDDPPGAECRRKPASPNSVPGSDREPEEWAESGGGYGLLRSTNAACDSRDRSETYSRGSMIRPQTSRTYCSGTSTSL